MKNVLIVDDDPVYVEIASTILKNLGMSVVGTASSGLEATNLLPSCPEVELIILDLNMPDFDGVEFLGQLKEHQNKPTIIIVSAANSMVRNSATRLAQAYGIKILGTIEKPLNAAKLFEALNVRGAK